MADFDKYKSVAVSQSDVWQSHKARIVERLSRALVTSCSLEYGSPEQRPVVSFVVGLVLLLPGAISGEHLSYFFATESSHIHLRYEAAMLLMGLIGGWL